MRLKEILEGDNPNSAYGWTGVIATPVQPASPRADKGQAADDSLQLKLGTYVALEPTQKTKQKLIFFCEDNGIKNHVERDDMHCTLLQSTTYLDGFAAAGHFEYPLIGSNLRCMLFKKKSKDGTRNILVVALDSPQIEMRRNRILEDFADCYTAYKPDEGYTPHIMLCYDLEVEVDVNVLSYNLAKYLDVVEFSAEFEEALDVAPSATGRK